MPTKEVLCAECEIEKQMMEAPGNKRVLSCSPKPGNPGICILTYEFVFMAAAAEAATEAAAAPGAPAAIARAAAKARVPADGGLVAFSKHAVPMTREGLGEALQIIGLAAGQSAALWAVFEVETAGTTQGFGFRSDRRPQMLFERHKFREFTDGRFDAAAPDVSGPRGGYGTLASQYERIDKAILLSRTGGLGVEPALKSASWGLGQVMGFNHEAAGYASARAMVEQMVEEEDMQVIAMANFMARNGLDKHIRNQAWDKFARGYNGPSYAENHYDLKLAEQYARFSSGSTPNLENRSAQAALLILGYSPGKVDGVIGPRTKTALINFQTTHQLPPGGELTPETYASLFDAAFK